MASNTNTITLSTRRRQKLQRKTRKMNVHRMYPEENREDDVYDTVIVGGGIAGLYRAYCLLRRTPDSKLLLVEKRPDLGGRIYTYKDDTMMVEAGAGRFSNQHKRLWKLIHDLGLGIKSCRFVAGFRIFRRGWTAKLPMVPKKKLPK